MIHISLRQVFGGSETSFPKSQTSHLIIEHTSSLLAYGLTFSFINVLATNTTFPISCPFNKRAVVTFRLQDMNNSSEAICISQGCDTGNSECSSGLLDAPSFLLEYSLHARTPSPGAGILLMRGHTMFSPALGKFWVARFKSFCRNGEKDALTVIPRLPGTSGPLL